MDRAGAEIDVVIDINPAKQGKFLAATGLQVGSPEEALPGLAAGADIFVMNSNYLDEIRELTANRFNYLPKGLPKSITCETGAISNCWTPARTPLNLT